MRLVCVFWEGHGAILPAHSPGPHAQSRLLPFSETVSHLGPTITRCPSINTGKTTPLCRWTRLAVCRRQGQRGFCAGLGIGLGGWDLSNNRGGPRTISPSICLVLQANPWTLGGTQQNVLPAWSLGSTSLEVATGRSGTRCAGFDPVLNRRPLLRRQHIATRHLSSAGLIGTETGADVGASR